MKFRKCSQFCSSNTFGLLSVFLLDAFASQLASVLDGFNRNKTPKHTKTRLKLRSIVGILWEENDFTYSRQLTHEMKESSLVIYNDDTDWPIGVCCLPIRSFSTCNTLVILEDLLTCKKMGEKKKTIISYIFIGWKSVKRLYIAVFAQGS